MNTQRQFDVIDPISVLSFLLGYENLMENRSQSAQNDVQVANDKQASYLLEEMSKRFDSLQAALDKILEVLTNGNQ